MCLFCLPTESVASEITHTVSCQMLAEKECKLGKDYWKDKKINEENLRFLGQNLNRIILISCMLGMKVSLP